MLSFFGDQKGKGKQPTAFISKGAIKKPIIKSPITTNSSSIGNGNGTSSSIAGGKSNGGSLKVPSSNGTLRKSPSPNTKMTSSNSSSSPSSKNRDRNRDRPSTSKSPLPSSSSTKTKRKIVERIQSESESSDSDSDAFDTNTISIKKQRTSINKLNGNRNGGSKGTTPFPGEEEIGRQVFCLDLVDSRGEWGRGWNGFVGCEEVVRGNLGGWAGGGKENTKNLEKYQAYFPQPGFENSEPLPSVELLYPATGCREKFILLTPTSHREYNPISELRTALRMILDYYIPPSHQHIFGTLSDSLVDPIDGHSAVVSRIMSPLPSALATPPPDPSSSPAPASTPLQMQETIGDALRKALAPNRRDGPGLVRAMERFNTAMAELQVDGAMNEWLKVKGPTMKAREWSSLVDVVHDQAYSRVVGPYSDELEHHPKHPDEVARAISGKEDAYGELRHNFMSKVIEQTNLGPESVFVDLGSGVGNCVVQAALQAGARSYGFELLPVPARCARLQLREAQRRWSMWGLNGTLDIEVHQGDFRIHPSVAKRLREADVVLVNNEVFPSSLNIDLTHMFLDLKEGAKIVSLKPFVPDGFRMNESNCDSFAAIVKSKQYDYYKDWVSWKGDSGNYYIQVIDRSMRAKYEEEMTGRARASRR